MYEDRIISVPRNTTEISKFFAISRVAEILLTTLWCCASYSLFSGIIWSFLEILEIVTDSFQLDEEHIFIFDWNLFGGVISFKDQAFKATQVPFVFWALSITLLRCIVMRWDFHTIFYVVRRSYFRFMWKCVIVLHIKVEFLYCRSVAFVCSLPSFTDLEENNRVVKFCSYCEYSNDHRQFKFIPIHQGNNKRNAFIVRTIGKFRYGAVGKAPKIFKLHISIHEISCLYQKITVCDWMENSSFSLRRWI